MPYQGVLLLLAIFAIFFAASWFSYQGGYNHAIKDCKEKEIQDFLKDQETENIKTHKHEQHPER